MNPFYSPDDSDDGVPTYRLPEDVFDAYARAERLDRFEDLPIHQ